MVKLYKMLVIIVAVIVVMSNGASAGSSNQVLIEGRAIDVIDGNIIIVVVEDSDPSILEVMLYGVAVSDITLERDGDSMYVKVPPHADDAYMYFATEVFGQSVTVNAISLADHGRIVGEIFVGDKNINLEVLSKGFGTLDGNYLQEQDLEKYVQAVSQARLDRAGVWGDNDSMTSK